MSLYRTRQRPLNWTLGYWRSCPFAVIPRDRNFVKAPELERLHCKDAAMSAVELNECREDRGCIYRCSYTIKLGVC
jgi:hypothetical protein